MDFKQRETCDISAVEYFVNRCKSNIFYIKYFEISFNPQLIVIYNITNCMSNPYGGFSLLNIGIKRFSALVLQIWTIFKKNLFSTN